MGVTSPTFTRSFSGGELSPELAMRADLARYQMGLRTCRNFIVRRNGGASNRAGFRYIGPAKTNNANVKLIRYVSDVKGQSMLIEVGDGYLRFYLNGGQVTIDLSTVSVWDNATTYAIGDVVKSGGVAYYSTADGNLNHDPTSQPSAFWGPAMTGSIYEVPTVFGATGLVNVSQSGRVITLTSKAQDVPPYELIFVDVDHWVLRPVTTTPQVGAPQNPVLTRGAAGTLSYGYVVTAAHPVTYEESAASAQVINAACAVPTQAAPNLVQWDVVTTDGVDSPEYYVYCDPFGNGTYGFIGTATGANEFHDPGITPDFTLTPPVAVDLFADAGDYPAVSATWQQRRFFARTPNAGDQVNASRVGLPSNFGISSPLQDDDAVAFKIAGNDNHPVQQMAALKAGLVLLTGAGEWTCRGPQGNALAPNAIDLEQETYVGASADVQPVVAGNAVIYVQEQGSRVCEVRFDIQVEGLDGKDLTVLSSHLFDGRQITAMSFSKNPDPIVWAVRDDGSLLGLTYVPEQDVLAWHRHDTLDGDIVDVCVVPEAGGDVPYVITFRDFGAGTFVSIEKLESRLVTDITDSFFVDAGLSYVGSPVSSVAGLDHLEGQRVAIVADGTVVSDGATGQAYVVAGGAVPLPGSFSKVHVGLPIQFAELEAMDLDVSGAEVRDKKKRVQAMQVALYQSARSFSVARAKTAPLTKFTPSPGDPIASLFDGDVALNVQASWSDTGRVYLRQTDPLPITVLGFVPQIELGG